MKKLIALLLALTLLASSVVAISEEAATQTQAEETVQYVATADVALKVRRAPGKNENGVGSIAKDETVYILELGAEWCKIRLPRTAGYVQSKYLSDLRHYDASSSTVGEAASMPEEAAPTAIVTENGFTARFVSYAVRSTALREQPDAKGRQRTTVKTYDEVLVSHFEGDWSYIKYNEYYGYVKTGDLFKWDRIDPYAGTIPGSIVYPLMAVVKRTTDVIDYAGGKKVLKTINPGACVAVERPDEEERYKTPYWRTTGYITEDDIQTLFEVVPYETAQPGDMIAVMTTYYAVGISTVQYQGRNWNIYLSTSMISGMTLEAGAEFNVNEVIGPYRKSTGYKSAPIASPTALVGYGGGTCQVNTTLYNTIIQLPIYVNHRKVHANIGAKYIPKGFDAAVGGGDINMIFTNTLPYAIRFNYMMSDGVLTLCIFRV